MKALCTAALRELGIMATMHVVCYVFLSLMISDILWISVLSSVLAVLIYAVVAYADGASRGEKAAGISERVQKQRETTGREPDKREIEEMFEPWKGFAIAGIALGYTLAALITATTAISVGTNTAFGDVFFWVFRLTMSPFIGLYYLLARLDASLVGVAAAHILSPIVFPLTSAIAWQAGPKLRARLHKTIADNQTTYAKRSKRERKRRLRDYDRQNLDFETKKSAGKKRPRA